MQLSAVIFISLLCFLAFSIGLNLGLHGLLEFAPNNGPNIAVVRDGVSRDSTISDFAQNQDSIQLTSSNSKQDYTLTLDSTKFGNHNSSVDPYLRQIEDTKKQSFDMNTKEAIEDVRQTLDGVTNSQEYEQLISEKISAGQFVSDHSITSYISENGQALPILLMTCNRPDLLQQTIKSLLSVKGVNAVNVLASQDGTNADVKSVLVANSIPFIQNTEGLNLRGGVPLDGAQRIARHYKFSLTAAFRIFPKATAVIVVEDDLLFSPDFYEYFISTAPILEQDKSLFLISAWNDNGFKGKVKEPFALRRTEFFPGLGWLLPRKLFESELRDKWPNEHWDHWLRSHDTHKGREIAYPQVPRSYHNGIKGTFMNLETHNRYFRDIDYNLNSDLIWPQVGVDGCKYPPYITLQKDVYEMRIKQMVASCTHISTIQELAAAKGIVCIWINVYPDSGQTEYQSISSFFGIWHEHQRGSHHGLHEFYWNDLYILVLNLYPSIQISNYKNLMPSTVSIASPNIFIKNNYYLYRKNDLKYSLEVSSDAGLSCDQVCRNSKQSCVDEYLSLVNSCADLRKKFPCQDCIDSIGPDQPAYVNPLASKEHQPGKCLVNSRPDLARCSSSHPATMRLCACV